MKKLAGIIILISVCYAALPVEPARADDAVSAALIQAFRHGNAGALLRFFPETGRVRLAITGVNISPGNYSAKQAAALLQQAFGQFDTVSFSLETRQGAVKGTWVVRCRNTDTQKTIVVYVSIQTHGDTQAITSIRGS